jgi:hypothetical protein
MIPNPTPNPDSFDATSEEQKLLLQLRSNPLLAEQFKEIANKFEQEISNGMDAHQAEAAMIESLQELGKSMMHQWAKNTQDKIIGEHSELQKHAKKNSSGIQPSE